MGGLVYTSFVFSIFHKSLRRIDRAYSCGISGENGWQRLFEGTRLQYVFDRRPKQGYEVVIDSGHNGSKERLSIDDSSDGRQSDLESSWVEDLGATWRVKDTEKGLNNLVL